MFPQRLKAALHYAVGKICKQVGEENDLRFSRELVAVITETTFKQCHTLAVDLELFAKCVTLLQSLSLVCFEHNFAFLFQNNFIMIVIHVDTCTCVFECLHHSQLCYNKFIAGN